MLLLAGCRVPIPEQKNEAQYDDGSNFNVINAVDASPDGSDAGAVVFDRRMPATFQGRWGLVPADCTSTRGDAKGLMVVEADRLSFYESRAGVTKLDAVSSTELRATLSFSGEGQEWTEETPLVLEDGGNAMTRFAGGQTLRYTRCGS
jgi:hypothetical protein